MGDRKSGWTRWLWFASVAPLAVLWLFLVGKVDRAPDVGRAKAYVSHVYVRDFPSTDPNADPL